MFSNLFHKSNASHEPSEAAKVCAENEQRIIYESIQLITVTKNPDTFFSRYNVLMRSLNQLKSYGPYFKIYYCDGEKDASCVINEIESIKQNYIYNLISRSWAKTEKRINDLKTAEEKMDALSEFFDNLDAYKEQISHDNINYYHRLYKNKCNELNLM